MRKPGRIVRRGVLGGEYVRAMLAALVQTSVLPIVGVAAITSTSLDIKMAGGERVRESTLNAAEACMSSGVQIIQQTLQNGAVPGTLTAAGAHPVPGPSNKNSGPASLVSAADPLFSGD